jgi:hypothetical protein
MLEVWNMIFHTNHPDMTGNNTRGINNKDKHIPAFEPISNIFHPPQHVSSVSSLHGHLNPSESNINHFLQSVEKNMVPV